MPESSGKMESMNIADLHPWPEGHREALLQQELFARGVVLSNELPADINTVAGVDVSYE